MRFTVTGLTLLTLSSQAAAQFGPPLTAATATGTRRVLAADLDGDGDYDWDDYNLRQW